jgi:hypothetical protein
MSELGYSFARNAYEIHVLYSDTWCDTVRSAGDCSLKELRHFIASSWYEICGELSEGHLLAGTHVEDVRN